MPSNDTALEGGKIVDAIHSILTGSPFKIRPDDEKLTILKKGRPLYNLNITKRDSSRNCSKTFHFSWYNIYKWLCGSESYNKLFCWPCLLMRPETSSWCSIGNDDMKRFTSIATKHARCKSHLKAICEYDETLASFGLTPEYMNELKFKCKEEEEEEDSTSDKTEPDDLENLCFQSEERKEGITEDKHRYGSKPTTVGLNENQDTAKINNKITFKTWQEMWKNNFPVSKSGTFDDFHLHKCKRKIAKQELRNARLLGEKLKFEIEVLKAKLDYYKALKADKALDGEPSAVTLSEVLESQSKESF